MGKYLKVVLLLVALLAGTTATAVAQDATPKAGTNDTNALGDPVIGATVPYVGPSGNELGTITIEDLTDPFEDYDESFAPDRGNRFVSVHITIDNTGTKALEYNSFDFLAQDDQGFLFGDSFIARDQATEQKDPALDSGEIDAGDSVTGFLAFQVPNDANLVRLFFAPENGRLITLADVRES